METTKTKSRSIFNHAESLLLRIKAAGLEPAVSQHTREGSIEIPSPFKKSSPIVSATIGAEGIYAELNGVKTSTGADLYGVVHSMPSRGLWLPHIMVQGRLVSDMRGSELDTFDSRNSDTIASIEHFTVVSELVRRIGSCAAKCSIQHSTES